MQNQNNSVVQTGIQGTYNWFAVAKPEPVEKDLATQLGVHFEEVREMLVELDSQDEQISRLIKEAAHHIGELADALKASKATVVIDDPVSLLDSLCDQVVTLTGSAYFLDMDIVGALDEVNASNFSKFDSNGTPILDTNRKIIKGPNYFKPNLAQYVMPE